MIQVSAMRRPQAGLAPAPVVGGPDPEEIALHWLEADPIPRLIVDSRLIICWLNASAERELGRRLDILRYGDLLMPVNPAHRLELLAAMKRCGEEVQTLCLSSADRHSHLLAGVQRLPSQRFGLTLRRCGDEYRPRYVDFAEAFQLTPREARVLHCLADGYAASQAASKLGISTQTVRTYIKKLYTKLDVTTREALLSRIRAYQI